MSDEATPPVSDIAVISELRSNAMPAQRPIAIRIPKPEGFDEREFCGAPLDAEDLSKGYCQRLREECTRHCGAWARSKGYPCPQNKAAGRNRCRMHGGAQPVMSASPQYQGKGRSKYLPRELRGQYEEIMARPDLLSLRNEIGLVQLRVQQLTEQLSTKASQAVFDDLGDLWEAYKQAGAAGDGDKAVALQTALDAKVREGAAIGQKWRELIGTAKDKAHLARLEMENMIDAHQMISVERVILMISELGDLVQRTVKDKSALAIISSELVGILGRRPSAKRVAATAEVESV